MLPPERWRIVQPPEVAGARELPWQESRKFQKLPEGNGLLRLSSQILEQQSAGALDRAVGEPIRQTHNSRRTELRKRHRWPHQAREAGGPPQQTERWQLPPGGETTDHAALAGGSKIACSMDVQIDLVSIQVGLSSDADPGKRTEQSKDIQEPQNDGNDHNRIQDRLDGTCHWDESINQP
jgi:hypothetical protein